MADTPSKDKPTGDGPAEDQAEKLMGEADRSTAVARIGLSLMIAWVALVAIPGAVPWTATDDLARALADGMVIASVVALFGLAMALVLTGSTADAGARVGVAAGVVALVLTGLEVANLMLLTTSKLDRQAATGIGLIVLLIAALGYLTAPRFGSFGGFFGGFKLSTLSLAGTAAAMVLIGVYLLLVQSMSNRTGSGTSDAEWIRLNSLLGGLQALAFAAAGALLGTAVQAQATHDAADDAEAADDANEELADTVTDLQAKLQSGRLVAVTGPAAIREAVGSALLERPEPYLENPTHRLLRVTELHRSAVRVDDELAQELQRSLDTARRLRRRRG